jgi:hypothetical protein
MDDYLNLVDLLKWEKPEGNSVEKLLVIAFDDTQAFSNWKNKYLPSHILGQIIKQYSTPSTPHSLSAWAIFTSTNSRMSHFPAPVQLREPRLTSSFETDLTAFTDASQRVDQGGELLFSPFSSLQLDIFAKPLKELDILSVGSYHDVIQFGRPL